MNKIKRKSKKALRADLLTIKTEHQNRQGQIWKIEEELYRRDIEPKLKALVGKCFKYRNSYGSGHPPWWLYCKIIGYEKTNVIVCDCQTDCHGKVSIEPKHTCFSFHDEPRAHHLFEHTISAKQFDAAINRAIKQLENMKG